MNKHRNKCSLFSTPDDFQKYFEGLGYIYVGKHKVSEETYIFKFINPKKLVYSAKYPMICYVFKTKIGWSPECFTKKQMTDINTTQETFWKGACEYDNNL